MTPRVFLALSLLLVQPLALAERPMRGTYSVPMPANPDGTVPANTYDVRFHSDTYDTAPMTLRFPMPAGLLGNETWVTFEREPQVDGQYKGINGTGHCQKIDRTLECTFRFDDLTPDLQAVESYWRTQGVADGILNQRLLVAEKFGGEPIGILKYKLRGRDRK